MQTKWRQVTVSDAAPFTPYSSGPAGESIHVFTTATCAAQVLERRKMASSAWFSGHLARLTAQIREGRPAEEVTALEAADAAEATELAAMHTTPSSPAELDLPGAHLAHHCVWGS